MKKKHPLEYIAIPQRLAENPYSKLKENSLLITNFPRDVEITKSFVQELCLRQDQSAKLSDIHMYDAITGQNKIDRNQVGYVVVEFTDKKWVQSVRRGLLK